MSTQPGRGDNRHPDLEVDSDRLAAVLRAAAAPAHPGELAGEEAALVAFRAAAETAPGPPSLWRTVLAKVLTVKAVIALTVAGSAGVVVAATGGVLPTPWSADPPAEQSSTAAPAPPPAPTARTTEPGSPETTAPETPSIAELCERYASHENPEKALTDPAFRPLVTAAGKKDKVTDYCAVHTSQSPRTGESPDKGKGKPDDKGKPGTKPEKTGGNGNGRQPTEGGRPPAPGGAVPPGRGEPR